MTDNETKRNVASKLVIELRNALGKTQQQFAVEVVKTAIVTVARWETNHPPKGETLLRLAGIAWENGQTRLSGDFTLLFLDEVMPRLHEKGMLRFGPASAESGYVICRFDNAADEAWAITWLRDCADKLEESGASASAVPPNSQSGKPVTPMVQKGKNGKAKTR